MKVRTIVSRTFLAGLAVVSGLAMTAPAWAASPGGNQLKICLKVLKPHCIRL
jgi:hypothetical protein